MTDLERISQAIKHLIYIGFAEDESNLAEKLGYHNTYLSQVKTGKKPISDKFINSLCKADNKLNKDWICKGKGKMLLDIPEQESITSDDYKEKYYKLLELRVDEQNKIIETLRNCLEEMHKTREQDSPRASSG